MKIDTTRISRLEVINHAKNKLMVGKILTVHKDLKHFETLEFSVQDEGRTLKIFMD